MNTLTFDEQVALLTKDLSGRLPYKVIISYPHTSYVLGIPNTRENAVLTGIDPLRREYSIGSKYTRTEGLRMTYREKILIKPYLRPLYSMTDDEKAELLSIISKETDMVCEQLKNGDYGIKEGKYHFNSFLEVDWLNAHHFDYRGLISLGLAIDVTTLEDNPYNDEFIY